MPARDAGGIPQAAVRGEPGRLVLVVWGNADAKLVQAWNALVWAFAELASGQIQTESGSYTPVEYRRRVDLPAVLHTSATGDKQKPGRAPCYSSGDGIQMLAECFLNCQRSDEALTIPEYCWLVATTQESTGRP
jgi:hypothetical protein